ncbi:mlo-like protein 4 [Fagus crenata]
MDEELKQGRSLAETPTYLVASVVTVMVFVCFLVERSIYRFGKWLKKTRRKALFVSLEKIKEEMMLLGLLSLLLAQSARWISEICVNSSLFTSRFYLCSEKDYGTNENIMLKSSFFATNATDIPPKGLSANQCGEGREPFVSYQGLEQLHRFLFVLGVTHVLYSCVAVGLAMSKIYSWRKWETQASLMAEENLQGTQQN